MYESYFLEVSSKTTAISRKKLARPILDWVANGYLENKKIIIDFGAGKGDNVRLLRNIYPNTKIIGYDPNYNNDYVTSNYSELPKCDLVISSFVLNVVPLNTQDEIISQMKSKSSKILIATRDDLINEMKKMKRFIDKTKLELYNIAIQGFSTGENRMQRLVADIDGFMEKGSKKNKYKVFVKGA